jgi:signal transduction histidine kinase
MGADAGVARMTPTWLNVAWIWLPALAGLALFVAIAVLQYAGGTGGATWWALAGVACAGAYAVRERWRVAALVVSLLVVAAVRLPGVGVLSSGFDVAYLLLLFVPVLPLVAVASALRLRWSSPALVGTVLVTVAVSPDPVWSTTTYSAQSTLVGYVLNLGVPVMIALGAWLAGCGILVRQRYADALLERAVSLERTRDAEAARGLAEERGRIARELHDVVTHTVAVMVVQAAAADAVWERDPNQARASLRAVEESGRTAMADLRGMLGGLRAGEAPAERRARSGIEQLSALVDEVRTTGLSARLSVAGSPDAIGAATGLSLLRIAQESVTNALRHAAASSIAIDLAVDEHALRLSIADDGVGYDGRQARVDALDPHRDGGHGVAGMRERAAVIGGTLEVGLGAEGGTVVTVRAPLGHEAPS